MSISTEVLILFAAVTNLQIRWRSDLPGLIASCQGDDRVLFFHKDVLCNNNESIQSVTLIGFCRLV